MNKQILTRNECNALRGLAIIGIFLHNYCHWLGPIVKENEYQYFQKNVDALNVALTHPDSNLPLHLLSFFGHYGVPIFLFLSAYGLVMKYERKPDVSVSSHSSASVIKYQLSQIWDFIRYHYLKLFKMMIVGFVAFTMVDAITPGRFHYDFLGVVAQLLMFNNVLPTPDKIIWPGPYWFFGLIFNYTSSIVCFSIADTGALRWLSSLFARLSNYRAIPREKHSTDGDTTSSAECYRLALAY